MVSASDETVRRERKNTRSFRARISRQRLSPWKTDFEKKKTKKTTTTTFLQSSVLWISESKCGDNFLKMSVVERMVQPSASPCWAEDLDNWRRKYIIFLTQYVWPGLNSEIVRRPCKPHPVEWHIPIWPNKGVSLPVNQITYVALVSCLTI